MIENNKKRICFATCPGGSNVSMIAYKTASLLEKEGYGKFVKLAGEKAREKDTARLKKAEQNADEWILIQGCSKDCGLEALTIGGIKPNKSLLITDFGIERENKMDYTKEEQKTVLNAVKNIIG
jgi:uncharacterized metal-binding protein